MVDSSTILKAAALPMSHTPTGVLKVEILGGLLFLGWCISTIGFHRWYKIYREDAILKDTKDELIEQRQDLLESIKDGFCCVVGSFGISKRAVALRVFLGDH